MPRNTIVAARLPQKTYFVLDDNIGSHVGFVAVVEQHGKRTVSMTEVQARYWLQAGAIGVEQPSPAQKVLLDQMHGIAVDDSVNEDHKHAVAKAAENAQRAKMEKREQEHHDTQVAQKKEAEAKSAKPAAKRVQSVPTASPSASPTVSNKKGE